MKLLRLTLSILILAAVANATTDYQPLDTRDLSNRAATYEGQLVAFTGRVCAINADGKSLQLFDADSKALIDVSLTRVPRVRRQALLLNPVHRISVYGRAEIRNGKLIINADRVVPQANETATTEDKAR